MLDFTRSETENARYSCTTLFQDIDRLRTGPKIGIKRFNICKNYNWNGFSIFHMFKFDFFFFQKVRSMVYDYDKIIHVAFARHHFPQTCLHTSSEMQLDICDRQYMQISSKIFGNLLIVKDLRSNNSENFLHCLYNKSNILS